MFMYAYICERMFMVYMYVHVCLCMFMYAHYSNHAYRTHKPTHLGLHFVCFIPRGYCTFELRQLVYVSDKQKQGYNLLSNLLGAPV